MVITFSKQEHHSRLLWCVASWGGTYIVQLVSVCFCGSLWESRTLHSATALLLHRAKVLEIDCNSMISSVWSEETTTWLTASIILISWSVTLCVQHVQPKVTDQDLCHCPNWALFQLVISLNTCVKGWLCIVYGIEFVQLHPLNTPHLHAHWV